MVVGGGVDDCAAKEELGVNALSKLRVCIVKLLIEGDDVPDADALTLAPEGLDVIEPCK